MGAGEGDGLDEGEQGRQARRPGGGATNKMFFAQFNILNGRAFLEHDYIRDRQRPPEPQRAESSAHKVERVRQPRSLLGDGLG
jgi:hypothetical protein